MKKKRIKAKNNDVKEKANEIGENNENDTDSFGFNSLTDLIHIFHQDSKHKDWHEINNECDCFDDDDNQTIIDFYDWKEKVDLLNANLLLDKISSRAAEKKILKTL